MRIPLTVLLRRLIEGDQRLQVLLRGSALVMATQIVGIGLAYAMQVAIARWSGPFEFGLFAYAWTWMNVLFLVAAFGLNETALRLIPAYTAHAEWAKLRGMVRRGPLVVTALAGGAGLVAMGAVLLLGERVGDHYRLPLLITFGAAPLLGLLAFLQGVGRAMGGVLVAFLPRAIGLPVAVLLAIAVFLALGQRPDALQLIAVAVAAAAVLGLVQTVMLIRRLPAEASAAITASPLGDWMRLSMPLLFIAVCYGLLTHCDLLMVGAFLSADQVAVYQAASRTAALVAFPLLALNALVAPMIARLYAEQRLDELQRSVSRATQMVFWPALAGGLLAIFGGGVILGLFGPAFPVGHTALAILVVGHLVSVACGPVTYLLTMTGHQDRCALVWAGTVVLQAVLNLLLIPRFGIDGAAVGTTLSTCVMTVSLTVLVRRRLDIRAHVFAAIGSLLPPSAITPHPSREIPPSC